MGQSTDAQLCFGIHIPESWDYENLKVDINHPWDFHFFWMQKNFVRLDNENIYNMEKRLKEDGFVLPKIIRHGSSDFPYYILTIDDSITVANRGYPQYVETFSPHKEWTDLLEQASKVLELDLKDPKWILSSDWGC